MFLAMYDYFRSQSVAHAAIFLQDPPPTKVVFRLITTIFGENFQSEFSRLYDTKKRAAFESNETFKNFFKKVSAVVTDNTATEHFLELLPCIDLFYEKEYNGYINFQQLLDENILNDPLTTQELHYSTEDKCQLIFKSLVKVRAKITDFMKRSGNGDSDPFLFAEAAIIACEKEKPSPIPKKLIVPHTAYYFYMQCMFFPVISSAFVTSLPSHVKVMSKKRSSDETIVIHSDDDNVDEDDLHRKSTHKKFGKQKNNMEAANKEYFMKAVCSSMESMSSSFAKRNSRKEHKEEIKDLQRSVARLEELERQYHNDIANCTDDAHKGLLIGSLKSLQQRLKKQDEELEKERVKYKNFEENELVEEVEWCNYKTPASHRMQHKLHKKSDNESSYASNSKSIRTTVKFSNTNTVAHAPYEESIDLLASPPPVKNDKTYPASKDLFAAKESIDLLASPTQDE
jgi:hypothetical protein